MKVSRSLVVILLIVGISLDLVLSLALGAVAIQARNAASQVHIARVAAYEACVSNNAAKREDAKRWNDVLALLDTQPMDAALQHFIAGVRKANAVADKPADCNRINPG